MTNLLNVCPDLDVSSFSHIIPSLERAGITTADLLTLDAFDVAKRAQVPPSEVKKLNSTLLDTLQISLELEKSQPNHGKKCCYISTLVDEFDLALGGGIALGQLTEIVGESAAGKTQLLLTLLLAAQLVDVKHAETPSSALYLSTEAPLQTSRLAQILKTHPKLANLPPHEKPSLIRIQSTQVHDVESQEHILRYQVPVVIEKYNVRLLVIDSIAANYRAEFDKGDGPRRSTELLAKRNAQLSEVGNLLRGLARKYNIAVVVANQVADRFTLIEPPMHTYSQSTQSTRPGSPSHTQAVPLDTPAPSSLSQTYLSTDDPLALDHQQRFFTGWGDDASVTNLKTPSLGLTWTNQLSTRIALLKNPIYADREYTLGEEREVVGWHRTWKIVFGSWCRSSQLDFEIWEGGVRKAVEEPPMPLV